MLVYYLGREEEERVWGDDDLVWDMLNVMFAGYLGRSLRLLKLRF